MSTETTTRRAWSIMTKSRAGTVSILRDLTLEECRRTFERLDPWYGQVSTQYEASDPNKRDPNIVSGGVSSGSGRTPEAGDIEIREVWGPPDWDRSEMNSWKHWPEFVTIKWDDPEHYRFRRGGLFHAVVGNAAEDIEAGDACVFENGVLRKAVKKT